MNLKHLFGLAVVGIACMAGMSSAMAQNFQEPVDGIRGPATKAIQDEIKKQGLRGYRKPNLVRVFYGDASGKGTKDAISFIYSSTGGNSEALDIWVWREYKGSYVLDKNAKTDQIFGLDPRDVSFVPGAISVTMTTLKPDDPRCCPSGMKTYSIVVK